MLTTILIFLGILVVLILSHEFGHFISAKKSGVKVEEFGLGLPPRLFGVRKGETLYSFNLFPFGGFVKIEGEDVKEGETIGPRSFAGKNIPIRALIISAGVIFNLILAFILFSFGFMFGTPTALDDADIAPDAKVIVVEVQDESPASVAGLVVGDVIVQLERGESLIVVSTIQEVQDFIDINKGEEIDLTYQRQGKDFTIQSVPRIETAEGEGALGIAMARVGIVKHSWHSAIWNGMKTTITLTGAIAVGLFSFFASLFTGGGGLESVAGPVGIVGLVKSAASFGFLYLIHFTAILSINLAVINLIPFPGLDGGRLFFLLIEAIKGSPVNAKASTIAHSTGLVILLVLMLVITYNDIVKLF